MVGLTLCRSFQQCTNSNSANNMRATFCAAFLFLMTRMQQSMANLATRLNRQKIGPQQFLKVWYFHLHLNLVQEFSSYDHEMLFGAPHAMFPHLVLKLVNERKLSSSDQTEAGGQT